MSIRIINGNIFSSTCQTLVNTVNCVGVMGAGIALECRLRYPSMFNKYKELCDSKAFKPGMLWLYKGTIANHDINEKWVLNFPTKIHWRYPSQIEWITLGLDKFLSVYRDKGITSIAFPVLGGLNGGLDPERVISIMQTKLSSCEIPIEIYKYKPDAPDDLYDRFKILCKSMSLNEAAKATGIRKGIISKVQEALARPDLCQLNQIAHVDGIGVKTIESIFRFSRTHILVQGELALNDEIKDSHIDNRST